MLYVSFNSHFSHTPTIQLAGSSCKRTKIKLVPAVKCLVLLKKKNCQKLSFLSSAYLHDGYVSISSYKRMQKGLETPASLHQREVTQSEVEGASFGGFKIFKELINK